MAEAFHQKPYAELDPQSQRAARDLFELVLADALQKLSDEMTAELRASGMAFQLKITAEFEPLEET